MMDVLEDDDDELVIWLDGSAELKTTGRAINRIWRLLSNSFQPGEWTTSKYMAVQVIRELNLPVNPEEIWGGKNRARYLFPLIYHPLKYLEKEGYIHFTGRGDVSRIR